MDNGLVVHNVNVIRDMEPSVLMGDRYVKVRYNVASITCIQSFYNITFPIATCPDCDVCPAQSVGLVRYPKTLAPDSGSQTVTTQCADNASPTTGLSVICHSDGTWSSSNTPKCLCNTGYKAISDNGREFCQGVLDVISHAALPAYVLPSALTLHPQLT